MKKVIPIAVLLSVGTSLAAHNLDKTFAFDFQKDTNLKDQFRPAGRDNEKYTAQDAQGFRITLPATTQKRPVVGLITKWRVHGDFEIRLSYQGFQSPVPESGSGPKLSIYVRRATDRGEAASIERLARQKDGDIFLAHTAYTDRDGGRRTSQWSDKASESAGGLQLKRTGPTLQFLVIDGTGTDYREVYRTDWGDEDLDLIRLGVDPGDSRQAFEVRITEFSVAADALPVGPASRASASWRWWVALVAVLVVGVVLWRYLSKAQNSEPAQLEKGVSKATDRSA